MIGKPLHKWEYKGKQPKGTLDVGKDWFECARCGFALVSYVGLSPAVGMQRLISHNSHLKTCTDPNCKEHDGESKK